MTTLIDHAISALIEARHAHQQGQVARALASIGNAIGLARQAYRRAVGEAVS